MKLEQTILNKLQDAKTYNSVSGNTLTLCDPITQICKRLEAFFKADDSIKPLPIPESGEENLPNNELEFTVTQKVTDPVTQEVSYQTYKLSIDDLRNRIISNDSLSGDTGIDDAEPGQIVFTEIPDEEGE